MMPRAMDRDFVRVLLAALSLTDVGGTLDFGRIAFETGITEKLVRTKLSGALGFDERAIRLSPDNRLRLAMEIARVGQLGNAAKALTWQEFEKFAADCLEEAGFEARKNVRVKGDGRAWQIDVVGLRGELVLAIDCKHWNTPGYLSKIKPAANHQRQAALHFLTALRKKTAEESGGLQALAVILALKEPPSQFSEHTVLVSIERFPSFLSGVTPYDENLPLIGLPLSVAENPMSQPE